MDAHDRIAAGTVCAALSEGPRGYACMQARTVTVHTKHGLPLLASLYTAPFPTTSAFLVIVMCDGKVRSGGRGE